MTEYEFTLRFTLPSEDLDMDSIADSLYGQGCDDAVIGIGQPGRLALDFTRRASSARKAVLSAISDVTDALPGVCLVEVAPDLVGVTDIAEMVGCSRQNIRQLMIACATGAPVPVHGGRQSLWHLALVLDWLAREKSYDVSASLIDLAGAAMQVNLAMDSLKADPETEEDLRTLFA